MMKWFKTITSIVVVIVVLLAPVDQAEAVPPLPASFHGTVQSDETNVPDGTVITAWIGDIKHGETQTTTYNGDSVYAIDVSGDQEWDPGAGQPSTEGATIVFKIGDGTAEQTATWTEGGDSTLDLSGVPTAVTLSSFTATAQDSPILTRVYTRFMADVPCPPTVTCVHHVLVIWETASEINTAGFNLYRSGYSNGIERGDLVSLNDGLIPSQALGSPSGASYSYTDTDVKAGTMYYYWLEDVEVTGSTHLYGPVSATLSRSQPYLPLIMKR